MKNLLSFSVFIFIKYLAKVFYTFDVKWLSKEQGFDQVKLGLLLNHTSLYEPIFLATSTNNFLWTLSQKMIIPAADKTLNRPVVGLFWKLLGPGIIPITRKKDASWSKFLRLINEGSIVFIAPEGRMKRKDGLDSNGRPMSVRSGVAEIVEQMSEGYLLIAYSGGLHHIQVPGQLLPKLFKKITVNFELIKISDYKLNFTSEGIPFRREVIADLESRMRVNCPEPR